MNGTSTYVTKLVSIRWNDPRMCTHNNNNEWYIYLRNKDTMSQSLPQPGGKPHIHTKIQIHGLNFDILMQNYCKYFVWQRTAV